MLGTMASVSAGVGWGVHMVRVHDVAETLSTVRVADSIYKQ